MFLKRKLIKHSGSNELGYSDLLSAKFRNCSTKQVV